MDDVSCKNKGVFTKEEMVASTTVPKSLKNVKVGSTKQQYPGKATEVCQIILMLHSKDWTIQKKDC